MEQVSPELLRLMRGWSHIPAFVTGRRLDVLARNALGSVLHDGLEYADNLLRLVFLDPAAREFYPDWEHVAGSPGWLTCAESRERTSTTRT